MLVSGVLLLAVITSVLSFVHLGTKVYWHDEAYTSLRVFGHTGPDYYHHMFDDRVHGLDELRSYQHASPGLGLAATLRALASRPEHTPLYFVLGRLWSGLFADPVVALRSLSAVFAMLMLPAVFWFAAELFDDARVSWTAVALLACSPLHLLYAQEAREYALWCLLLLLSGAALLRALRTGRRGAFHLYTVTLVLGLYAHIMFACAILCHAGYVALLRRRFPAGTAGRFLRALVLAALAFLPWLLLFLTSLHDVAQVTQWMHRPVALSRLAGSWLLSVNRLLFDFPGSAYLVPFSGVLAAGALLLLPRRTPVSAWLLPVLLVVITAGCVIVPDLLDGGRRSLETRYLLPALLVLQLCIAWLLATQGSPRSWRGGIAAGVTALVLAGGIFSQARIITASTWWNKSFSANNAAVAARIDSARHPLLISTLGEVNPGELLSLSYLLEDRVRFLLLSGAALPPLPPGFDRYFVLNMPWSEAQLRARGLTRERLPGVNSLWELRQAKGED
jgi:uncharacterized membrane protein